MLAVNTLIWPGCRTYDQSSEATEPTPKIHSMAATDATNAISLKSDLLQVTKQVPEKATLGSTIETDLNIKALAHCANVVITDTIPAGATYVKSEPPAMVTGNKLTWNFDTMEKGQVAHAKVWYKADKEGNLVTCATMTAIPIDCATTFVGKPMIAIEKSGPETAKLGTLVNYRIIVKNTGNADAENVVVTDTVPEGMKSINGKTLTFKLGTIAAGKSKEIPVALTAEARGKHCNVVNVATSNAGTAKAEACTLVMQPGLAITKTGTKEQYFGRNATYQVVVSNTGDSDLKEVVVTDTAPSATKIVSATGASISGNTSTWTIPNLSKGGKQAFDVVLTSETSGTHCNGVVATAEGLKESAEFCTQWKGIAAILLETKDDPDPIQMGENVTYTIRVTNQGTANDRNLKVTAEFGKEVSPISASAGGQVDGNKVIFAPVATLGPKQVLTYTITAKGTAPGDHRLKVDLTSDMLTSPVSHEESTRVY